MFSVIYIMITSKKIKELDERYNIILNELVKTYPNYKVYPNRESISREFTVDSENLLDVQTEFFQLRDKIQKTYTGIAPIQISKSELNASLGKG